MFPVAVRVAYNGKSIYLRIGKKYSLEDWTELCECEKQARNKRASERKELKAQMDKIVLIVNNLIDENAFSLQKVKQLHQGRKDEDSTIYSIWEAIIKAKRAEGKAGTARCSEDILRRFERDMGKEVILTDIDHNFIMDWVRVMKNNNLSMTSVGISLRVFRDLGLFLFMYLGDGQNLADTLRLTYDSWYFATHGKQFRFLRHKTRDRNEGASEVIFPITPELQKIIDKYGNKPKLDKRVFPIMSEWITPEQEVWVIQRYNRYIREHMAKVAELLNMEQRPSSTWARHSFATNLNNSGSVPYKYISDSMGHSGNGDVTSNYIGAYPLEKMLEYNWYLLNDKRRIGGKTTDKQTILELLKTMSNEERKELLASL